MYTAEEKEKAAGRVHEDVRGKFTREQKEVAVEHWRTHNFSIKETIEALDYPKKTTLSEWIEKYVGCVD